MKLKSFTLWIDSSLCCASFRMTKFCFYSQLGSYIIRELFLNAKIFYLLYFLRKQSWRNSFAMKRCGKCVYFSFTKFTEMRWNDCVFERTEEHRRCSVVGYSCEDVKSWSRDVEIFYFMNRFFTMLRFVQNDNVLFLLTIRKLYNWGIVFETQRFFYLLYALR